MADDAINITEIESYLATVESYVSELIAKIGMLPKVEEDGSSECPFAQKLYAEKEQAEAKVQVCLAKLGEYESWTHSEIARCRSNLTELIAHEQQLNRDSPKQKLSDAESKLAAVYNRLLNLAESIKETINKVEKALEKAGQKQYPQQALPQQPQMPSVSPQNPQMPPLPSQIPTGFDLGGNNFDNQLTGTLSIGPIE